MNWRSILVLAAITLGACVGPSPYAEREPTTPGPVIAPTPAPQAAPLVALVSSECNRQSTFIRCDGAVLNLASRPLRDVLVVIIWNDANDIPQRSDEALIAYNPLLVGQASTWSVVGTDNPALKTFRVAFKYISGETIPVRDDRKKP